VEHIGAREAGEAEEQQRGPRRGVATRGAATPGAATPGAATPENFT
jgi:hypothetical protein